MPIEPETAETETEDEDCVCHRCEEKIENEDAVLVHELVSRRPAEYVEFQWCASCYDSHAGTCTDCDEAYEIHRISHYRCPRCYENYFICDSCGELCNNDDYAEDGDCAECFNKRHDARVHEYSYKPTPIFHGKPGVCKYGVELEVSCDVDLAEDVLTALGGEEHAYLKEDSTIAGDGGFEIVSHPHTLTEHKKLWGNFFKTFSEDLDASQNAMHVHIQRYGRVSPAKPGSGLSGVVQHLTEFGAAKLDCLLSNYQEFTEAIADRKVEEWAKCQPKRPVTDRTARYDGRYVAVNRQPERTVEIRIFRGTMEVSRFFANLEFCDAARRFAMSKKPNDMTPEKFCEFVTSERKEYPELYKLLIELGTATPPPERKVKTQCA